MSAKQKIYTIDNNGYVHLGEIRLPRAGEAYLDEYGKPTHCYYDHEASDEPKRILVPVDQDGAPVVRLTVDVVVRDYDALREYAVARREACSFDSERWLEQDKPTMADMVLTALVTDNENPSPADYGIEIADYSTHCLV